MQLWTLSLETASAVKWPCMEVSRCMRSIVCWISLGAPVEAADSDKGTDVRTSGCRARYSEMANMQQILVQQQCPSCIHTVSRIYPVVAPLCYDLVQWGCHGFANFFYDFWTDYGHYGPQSYVKAKLTSSFLGVPGRFPNFLFFDNFAAVHQRRTNSHAFVILRIEPPLMRMDKYFSLILPQSTRVFTEYSTIKYSSNYYLNISSQWRNHEELPCFPAPCCAGRFYAGHLSFPEEDCPLCDDGVHGWSFPFFALFYCSQLIFPIMDVTFFKENELQWPKSLQKQYQQVFNQKGFCKYWESMSQK